MLKNKSIKVNAIFNAIYQILILIIPVVTIPYVSRVLGQSSIGEYSLYSSIVNYFVLFASYGFVDFGTKIISENRDNLYEKSKSFYNVMIGKSILTLFTLIVFFIYLYISNYSSTSFYSFIGLSFYIIAVLFDPTFYFQGEERFVSISIRNAIIRILTVVFTFVFVKSESDLVNYCFILGLGQIFSTVVMYFSFKKGDLCKVNIKDLSISESIKKAFPFFVPCIAIQLYAGVNQLLLNWYNLPTDENGFYGQAFKVVQLLSALPGSISIIMYSRISYLIKVSNQDEIKKKVIQTFQVFWIISLSLTFGLAAISRTFVPVFFGDGYDKVIYILYFLSPSIVVTSLNTLFGYLFFKPYSKVWLQTLVLFICSILDILISCLLIPSFMSYGVAIARCISDIIQIPLLFFFARKTIDFKVVFRTLIKPLISSTLMFILVFVLQFVFSEYLSSMFLNLFLLILIGALIFYIFEIILRDEFVMLYTKKIIQKLVSIFRKNIKN